MRPTQRTTLRREDLEFITTQQFAKDSLGLLQFLRPNTVGVIAIPRSGLTPASLVATIAHLPIFELMPDGKVRQLGSGGRGRNWIKSPNPHWLCIDDSSHSGHKMQKQEDNYKTSMCRLL
jgi:hypothetical protein